MSDSATSPESTSSPPTRAYKPSRLSGSCDVCRRRKVKCDSQLKPGQQCTNCRAHKVACTHDMPVQRPGIKNYSRQVTVLQQKVKELESQLRNAQAEKETVIARHSAEPITEIIEPNTNIKEEQTDLDYIRMMDDMKKFSISGNEKFYGPSSNIYFMRQLMSVKPVDDSPRRLFEAPVWALHPWESAAIKRSTLFFPDENLMQDLINIFFRWAPYYLLVLHEPTFRRDVASGLHHVDHTFGAILLVMCALASRLSDDRRVFMQETNSKYSAGWKYVEQTMYLHNPSFENGTLAHIQYCCLLAEYMLGSSNPQACWPIVGTAMRQAVELGLHRRRDDKPTAESELKKRVFWAVFTFDRNVSLFHGRPVSLGDDEYDVDYPLIVDDEYWETGHPESNFKQPAGKPSRLEATVWGIKISQITSFALKTVFGIRKSKEASSSKNWTQNHVLLVDSMLNGWFNSVPAHLRWDTSTRPQAFFDQSADLLMMYYNLQIFIHRPFVHSSSPLALPSLAICTNAARSCIRVLEARHHFGHIMSMMLSVTTFSASIALAMSMWQAVKAKKGVELPKKDIRDLEYGLASLKTAGQRFNMAFYLSKGLEGYMSGLPLGPGPTTSMSAPVSSEPSPPSVAVTSSKSWAPAGGYVVDPSLPDMVLDLDSFGVMPAEQTGQTNEWNGFPQVDMSVFDTDDLSSWMNIDAPAAHITPLNWVDPLNMNYWSENFFVNSENGQFA